MFKTISIAFAAQRYLSTRYHSRRFGHTNPISLSSPLFDRNSYWRDWEGKVHVQLGFSDEESQEASGSRVEKEVWSTRQPATRPQWKYQANAKGAGSA